MEIIQNSIYTCKIEVVDFPKSITNEYIKHNIITNEWHIINNFCSPIADSEPKFINFVEKENVSVYMQPLLQTNFIIVQWSFQLPLINALLGGYYRKIYKLQNYITSAGNNLPHASSKYKLKSFASRKINFTSIKSYRLTVVLNLLFLKFCFKNTAK